MSFWHGKNESLLQAMVEATYKSLFSGLVILVVANVVLLGVETQIELASKRNALATYKNSQLTHHLNKLSHAFSSLSCVRDPARVSENDCRSQITEFLTTTKSIKSEVSALFPNAEFNGLDALYSTGADLYRSGKPQPDERISAFTAHFSKALNEMAQHFQ